MRIMFLALIVAITAMWAWPANAQRTPCGPRAQIVDSLQRKYNERQMWVGQIGAATVLEIFVSEGGSWTAFVTSTNGMSCIKATGKSWTVGEDKPAPARHENPA